MEGSQGTAFEDDQSIPMKHALTKQVELSNRMLNMAADVLA